MNPIELKVFGARSGRGSFWAGLLGTIALTAVASAIAASGITDLRQFATSRHVMAGALLALISALLFVRVTGRRLHDCGHSGWIALVSLLFIDFVCQRDLNGQTLSLTLNPLLYWLFTIFGGSNLPVWLEAVRDFATFKLSVNGAGVRFSGLIWPLLLYAGFMRGQPAANRFGEALNDVPAGKSVDPEAGAGIPAQT